ncbi:MAG: sugar transferase [Verrucomicrobiota bacterium]
MSVDPASYWSDASDPKQIRSWARATRRKMWAWQATIQLTRALKRATDLLGGGAALLLLSPIFLVVALLIKKEDGGPIFFGQKRIGEAGRLFRMWKFRSMVPNADQLKDQLLDQNQYGEEGVNFKMKDDPRITKIGRFLRKYSLDELPQFYNVLRGEMSLVGPRPPVVREVQEYNAFHLRRLRARPGITCLWQIGGRSEIDFEGQVRLDLAYMQSAGFWGDLRILLKTVPAVLLGKGAY